MQSINFTTESLPKSIRRFARGADSSGRGLQQHATYIPVLLVVNSAIASDSVCAGRATHNPQHIHILCEPTDEIAVDGHGV